MALPELHGVVPILLTPFDAHGRIDAESLRNLVDFTIEAGVHGLGIALGSEVYKLTEAEREIVTRAVIEQVNGRVPVVVNTGAAATDLAIYYSNQSKEWGASAVMCTPPGVGFSPAEILDYFQAISDAVQLPVIIQDTAGTPVSAPLIRRICETCEWVSYAKVESIPPASQVYNAVEAGGDQVAIFGGAGGTMFLEEMRRGSIGTMPWPSTPHAFVQTWNAWQAGDSLRARELFDAQIWPLLRISVQGIGGHHRLHKEVLRRRGVIASAYVRPPAEALDPIALEELEEACDQLGY